MFFVFAIISFSIAYRRAKAIGRNGYLWGVIAAATFILTGISLTFGFRIFLGIGIELWNWSKNTIEAYTIISAIISMATSFGTTWLILRKLREPSKEILSKPPPPPTFEQH